MVAINIYILALINALFVAVIVYTVSLLLRMKKRFRDQLRLINKTDQSNERVLEVLENELQNLIWDSKTKQDKDKDLLFISLYYHSRAVLQNKQQEIENQHQKDLLKAVLRAEQKERERIARNVHDDLGIAITASRMNLSGMLEKKYIKASEKQIIRDNIDALDRMVNIARNITEDLASPTVRMLGYYKSVQGLTHLLNTARIKVAVHFEEKPRFELEKELQLYRISLEVINNIIKHTKATEIYITSNGADENSEDTISIEYNDRGITTGDVRGLSLQGGLGLTSIESRAQLINLEIQYLVHNNNSSEVLLRLRKEKKFMTIT